MSTQSTARHSVREIAAPLAIDAALALEIRRVAKAFVANLTPQMLAAFNGRLDRGLDLALSGAVCPEPTPSQPHLCRVQSAHNTESYLVDTAAKSCECPDSQKGHHCKHRIAAYYYSQATVKLNQSHQPAAKSSSQAQILKELGFDADTQPGARLGSLYRRFLHGEELGQQSLTVTITTITKETVTPHPSQPACEKWCLWVSGLPQGLPCGILFGAKGEHELLAIFGRANIETLKGKTVVIYPQPVTVAGQPRVAIHFRSAQ